MLQSFSDIRQTELRVQRKAFENDVPLKMRIFRAPITMATTQYIWKWLGDFYSTRMTQALTFYLSQVTGKREDQG